MQKNLLFLENCKKQAPKLNSYRIFKTHYFFTKITINDVEYVSKLYIKFCLKKLKNEFLMNIFLGLGFFYCAPFQAISQVSAIAAAPYNPGV